MTIIGRGLTALCGLAILATPAWAHPSTHVHAHSEELLSALILGVALGALLVLRRYRSLDNP